MISKIQKLVRAEFIIESILAERLEADCWIECYQNGREQGYQFTDFNTSLLVSEERRSDDIVIYEGEYSLQSISEDAYANKKFFETEQKAIQYLIES